MTTKNNLSKPNGSNLTKLVKMVVMLLVMVVLAMFVFIFTLINNYSKTTQIPAKQAEKQADKTKDIFWKPLEFNTISDKNELKKIVYGKELIVHTSLYFGPKGSIAKNRLNGMNCQNCHLDAGTKIFGNNYSAVATTYPKYRPRSGQTENIYKRINDCFERSLNGKEIDSSSKEMEAMVAYIYFLGKNVAKGTKPNGAGFKELVFLNRAIDPEKGKIAYQQKCVSCHQTNGQGVINPDGKSYSFPPLWGKNSYNNGAGLFRMSNFAKYIKYNMPLGATHTNATLTDEEAWDIAAFVNSQPRPKMNSSHDWPILTEKPFDLPFGPYVDGFTQTQHKFGPFGPIKEKLEKLKKK